MDLQEILSFPTMGIYAFVNEEDRKIYVGYSKNIVTAFSRLVQNLKYSNMQEDADKLKFVILENIVTERSLRLRYEYWSRKYSNEGWSLYRSYRAVSYRLRVDLFSDHSERSLIGVKIVSRGYKELTVGVFESVGESRAFINEYYKDGVDNLIYASNRLTKEFIDKYER